MPNYVEKLRDNWLAQIRQNKPLNQLGSELRHLQKTVNSIVDFRDELDGCKYYLPGVSGVMRLYIGVTEEKVPTILLVDSGRNESVQKRFDEITNVNSASDFQ